MQMKARKMVVARLDEVEKKKMGTAERKSDETKEHSLVRLIELETGTKDEASDCQRGAGGAKSHIQYVRHLLLPIKAAPAGPKKVIRGGSFLMSFFFLTSLRYWAGAVKPPGGSDGNDWAGAVKPPGRVCRWAGARGRSTTPKQQKRE